MPATACRVLILVGYAEPTIYVHVCHFSGSTFFYTDIDIEISIKDQTLSGYSQFNAFS